jgi:urease accessory protein
MQLAEPPFSNLAATWHARLELEYERRAVHGIERTVLAARRHDGPLVVQKALYPEGDAVCHSIIVHPPAGVVGGDRLTIDARVGRQGHALLTTPGAGKWYRSAGEWAQQCNDFLVAEDACLEWLPQETIVFNGAKARLDTTVSLKKNARYIGWEILCLGRAGSGERFDRGQCVSRVCVSRAGKPLWMERGGIDADGLLARSAAGLGGKTVCGTLIAVANNLDAMDIAACRAVVASSGATAVTRLPQVMAVRYLGDSSEAAKQYFADVWRLLRPAITGRAAVAPRIWST